MRHGRKEKMKPSRLLIIPVIISAFILASICHGSERQIPFSPGERLTLQVRWAFIPAGEMVLEILPFEKVNGIKSYHFAMTARTYPLVDPFYKVRDRIDAFTDAEITHSILYKKNQKFATLRLQLFA